MEAINILFANPRTIPESKDASTDNTKWLVMKLLASAQPCLDPVHAGNLQAVWLVSSETACILSIHDFKIL